MRRIWEEEGLFEERGTHAVGEVCNQVANLDFADFELAVKPAAVWLAALYSVDKGAGDAPFGKCFLLNLNPLLLKRRHGGLYASRPTCCAP